MELKFKRHTVNELINVDLTFKRKKAVNSVVGNY